jgi:large subunit ribosomal protein L4
MELKLINEQGESAATVSAPDTVFNRDYNEALIHQIVTDYEAQDRGGKRAHQSRGEVNKSHKKPWKQKGTGRARAGQANSPLWRGGGRIFPNSPDENFSHKVNRKMFRAGIASILSQLAREGRLSDVESLSVDAPKTKLHAQKIKAMGFGRVLIVTDSFDDNLYLSSRNLADVLVLTASQMDPVSLVHFPQVLLTKGAIAQLEESFA